MNSPSGQMQFGDNHLAGLPPEFTVSGAIAVFNQVLDTATPVIIVTGEVANFKINQGKWVFFDIKDDAGILNCFMPVYQSGHEAGHENNYINIIYLFIYEKSLYFWQR